MILQIFLTFFVHLASFPCFPSKFDGFIPIWHVGIFVLLLNMYAQFRIASFLTFRFCFSIFRILILNFGNYRDIMAPTGKRERKETSHEQQFVHVHAIEGVRHSGLFR